MNWLASMCSAACVSVRMAPRSESSSPQTSPPGAEGGLDTGDATASPLLHAASTGSTELGAAPECCRRCAGGSRSLRLPCRTAGRESVVAAIRRAGRCLAFTGGLNAHEKMHSMTTTKRKRALCWCPAGHFLTYKTQSRFEISEPQHTSRLHRPMMVSSPSIEYMYYS